MDTTPAVATSKVRSDIPQLFRLTESPPLQTTLLRPTPLQPTPQRRQPPRHPPQKTPRHQPYYAPASSQGPIHLHRPDTASESLAEILQRQPPDASPGKTRTRAHSRSPQPADRAESPETLELCRQRSRIHPSHLPEIYRSCRTTANRSASATARNSAAPSSSQTCELPRQ